MEIPGYTIVETLGQGGMATVYLAIQQSFDRQVALKVMSPQLLQSDPSFGDRFLREAKIVSHLVHPHIVTVFDVGVHEGHHYLSMEYVPGLDLKEKRFDLPLVERVSVIKQVAQALNYAGKKGYVHRDVKPENIMLHDEDGRAILMDFGIARAADTATGMTQTGIAIGTPHYMSPEQARGHAVDGRSDLYSLGVVLYLLLTGRVPFDAESAVAVGIKHISEPVPQLPSHLGVFQPIINRALAKAPEDRFQTGDELIAALNDIRDARLLAIESVVEELEQQAFNSGSGDDTLVSGTQQTAVSAPVAATEDVPVLSPDAGADAAPLETESKVELDAAPDLAAGRAQTRRRVDLAGLGLTAMLAVGTWLFMRPDMQPEWLKSYWPEGFSYQQTIARSVDSILNPLLGRRPALERSAVQRPVLEQKAQDSFESEPVSVALDAEPAPSDAIEDLAPVVADYQPAADGAERPEASAPSAEMPSTVVVSEVNVAIAPEQNSPEAATEQAAAELLRREREAEVREQMLQQQIAELLAQGQKQLTQDHLTEPADNNALATFEQVLALDAGNADAKAGIAQVVERYGELGKRHFARGNYNAAIAAYDRGLAVDANHAGLKQARQRALKARERERQITQLEQRARQLIGKRQFVRPANNNAIAVLKQIQQLDPSNSFARDRLALIERKLAERIGQTISQQEFAKAELHLKQGERVFPESALLAEQRRYLAAEIDARTPKVSLLQLAGHAIDGSAVIRGVDRVLEGRFAFKDFQTDTAVVQAVLYDGSRSLQIGQVPVLVSGRSGRAEFRFERPVEGFAAGGYHLDLLLGGNRLASTVFKIEN